MTVYVCLCVCESRCVCIRILVSGMHVDVVGDVLIPINSGSSWGGGGGRGMVRKDSLNEGSDSSLFVGESPIQCLFNLFRQKGELTLVQVLH